MRIYYEILPDGVSFKVVHDVRMEDVFPDLVANRREGYWTIVGRCTPFLKIGTTWAIFQSYGTPLLPSENVLI